MRSYVCRSFQIEMSLYRVCLKYVGILTVAGLPGHDEHSWTPHITTSIRLLRVKGMSDERQSRPTFVGVGCPTKSVNHDTRPIVLYATSYVIS